jgi:hypothetical protein
VWLWRLVTWGFGVALAMIVVLAWGLAQGWADPPRAGPVVRFDDFKSDLGQWAFSVPEEASLVPTESGLRATFTAPDQLVLGVTAGPAGDFTLEVAGAQTAGETGAAYGLIIGWQDAAHYHAVLINGNGYAEAYRVDGAARADWFAWQQWPHILVGGVSNRVRVDVRGRRVIARVNDELLAETTAAARGQVGLIARGLEPDQTVIFSWIQIWTK